MQTPPDWHQADTEFNIIEKVADTKNSIDVDLGLLMSQSSPGNTGTIPGTTRHRLAVIVQFWSYGPHSLVEPKCELKSYDFWHLQLTCHISK